MTAVIDNGVKVLKTVKDRDTACKLAKELSKKTNRRLNVRDNDIHWPIWTCFKNGEELTHRVETFLDSNAPVERAPRVTPWDKPTYNYNDELEY
jgi:hypothetical protein